ncbi:hypothetical protein [Chelativorans xinjiangense]|uniref:hypothetical protein n=1 Tax=Chelativorans xinjiangense TaxID=2681485 RepID=UPI00135A27AB|nr:hypothetical protein [Chelativorans xinjiangense]
MKAKIINVSLTKANSLVYATSNDLPGLYVSGRDEASVMANIPEAIRVMYLADGIEVLVSETEAADTHVPAPWVAVPVTRAA